MFNDIFCNGTRLLNEKYLKQPRSQINNSEYSKDELNKRDDYIRDGKFKMEQMFDDIILKHNVKRIDSIWHYKP